ncbi:MAG: phytanoyl-CoA dioxygenase family protein [Chloroflexota bacterium]
MEPLKPTDMEIYLFDLRGFIVLKNALSPEEVAELNASIDNMLPIEHGDWHGNVHAHGFGAGDGLNLQQIYEGGDCWERLIDHPSWIEKAKFFVGGEGSYDWLHGPLFIDENFANVREPGEAIPIHSGGHENVKRTQYLYRNGSFMCGQVNVLIAISNMGPGDGTTMVIPGSHKSNFKHPEFDKYNFGSEKAAGDGMTGAIEVFMEPGDALMFVDAICHGSARRTNPGQRRMSVYRYGPSWGNFRHGYQPSLELLERLTPERRGIVQPLRQVKRKGLG